MRKVLFAYRPSVAAIIVNDRREFLLVQLNDADRLYLWDFVKGGRNKGETRKQALNREIREELGPDFRYKILKESEWFYIYDWTPKIQKRMGFIGQARASFWVKHTGGNYKLNPKELTEAKWFPENRLKAILEKSHFPAKSIQEILNEWKDIKKNIFTKI